MFTKKDLYLFLTLVLIFSAFYLYHAAGNKLSYVPFFSSSTKHPAKSDTILNNITASAGYGNVIVEISGEVLNPGTYTVKKGTNLKELINENTPLLKTAKAGIDLDVLIYEDTRIYIPKTLNYEKYAESEFKILTNEDLIRLPPRVAESEGAEGQKDGPVNINTASKEELTVLPGIGPKIAEAVIEYRQKNKFKSIEEIKEVPRIGEKTFENIKDRITVK